MFGCLIYSPQEGYLTNCGYHFVDRPFLRPSMAIPVLKNTWTSACCGAMFACLDAENEVCVRAGYIKMYNINVQYIRY